MLVQFDFSILKEAVKNGSKMANKVRATPLYLSIDNDTLSVKVFDADLMTQIYSCEIQPSGCKLVLAFDVNILSPLVNGAKAKLFTIDAFDESSKVVSVTLDGVSYKLHSLDPSEFEEPSIHVPENTKPLVFRNGELRNILKRLKPFLSKDEYRLSMQCVNMEIKDGVIRFCATDSFRLATYESKVEYEDELNLNIPEVAVDVLMSLGDEIAMYFDKDNENAVRKVVAQSENITIEFFGIAANFPNYKPLLPDEIIWKAQYDAHNITEKIDSMNKVFNMYSPGSIQKEAERAAAKLIFDIHQFDTKLLSVGSSEEVMAEATIMNEVETTKECICINPFHFISIAKSIRSSTINNSVIIGKTRNHANLVFVSSDAEPEWLYVNVLKREQ